jgi:hypothetical protein
MDALATTDQAILMQQLIAVLMTGDAPSPKASAAEMDQKDLTIIPPLKRYPQAHD